MSISNTKGVGNQVDLNYRLINPTPPKAPLKSDTYQGHPTEDTLSISQEGKALLEEDKEKDLGINNYSQEELDRMFEQLEDSTDESNSPLKIQLQCLKIAMRIISGDNVPSKDLAFLAEHEPDMLGRAMLLRQTRENPRDYKSILENEKADKPTNSSGGVSLRESESMPAEFTANDNPEPSVDIEK